MSKKRNKHNIPDAYFAIRQLAGTDLDDCRIAADISPVQYFDDESQEAAIIRRVAGKMQISFRAPGLISRMWIAPSGRLWVAGRPRGEYGLFCGAPDSNGNDQLERVDLPNQTATVAGVFGTGDDDIFAWGGGYLRPALSWHWNGEQWRVVPTAERILDVHGPSSALVHAVGKAGFCARWTGSGWNAYAPPSPQAIDRVHVADENRIFACATGRVYVGSSDGWELRTEPAMGLDDLTVWRGQVVFVNQTCAHRLDGSRLVPLVDVGPKTAGSQIESDGDRVLVRHRLRVFDTGDFKRFRFVTDKEIGELIGAVTTGEPRR